MREQRMIRRPGKPMCGIPRDTQLSRFAAGQSPLRPLARRPALSNA